MQRDDVTEEDARNSVKWRKMIHKGEQPKEDQRFLLPVQQPTMSE